MELLKQFEDIKAEIDKRVNRRLPALCVDDLVELKPNSKTIKNVCFYLSFKMNALSDRKIFFIYVY